MKESQPQEHEMQDKCATGADDTAIPRIVYSDLEDRIVGEYYFTAMNGLTGASEITGIGLVESISQHETSLNLLTFCVLVLRNGFSVTGESACASPENFNVEIGRSIARQNAVNKIYPLLGYELKSILAGL